MKKNKDALRKRRECIFRKGRELSILCGAEVAIINLTDDGSIHEQSTSSMKRILARYNKTLMAKNQPTLPFLPETTEDVGDAIREDEQEMLSKEGKLVSKDLTKMSSEERRVLHQRLKEGILLLRDRKAQLMKAETAELKLKQKGYLEGSIPSTSRAMALVETEENISRLGDREVVASTSLNTIEYSDEDMLDTTLSLGPTRRQRDTP